MTHQVSRHSLAFLFIVTLILVACERPLQQPLLPDLPPTEVVVEAPDTVAEESATPVPEVVTLPPETMEGAPETATPSEIAQPSVTESESAGEAETETEATATEAAEAAEVDEEAASAETGEAEAAEESEAAAESGEEPAEDEQAAEDQEAAAEPAPDESEAAAPAEEAGSGEAGEVTQTEAEEPGEEDTAPLTHVVAAGETLFRIGQHYGISWVTLAQINHLADPSDLEIGQVLIIATEAVPEPAPAQTVYVVQPGDTVFRISLRFGVDWRAIAEENGLEAPYVIYPGDELVIPGDP